MEKDLSNVLLSVEVKWTIPNEKFCVTVLLKVRRVNSRKRPRQHGHVKNNKFVRGETKEDLDAYCDQSAGFTVNACSNKEQFEKLLHKLFLTWHKILDFLHSQLVECTEMLMSLSNWISIE